MALEDQIQKQDLIKAIEAIKFRAEKQQEDNNPLESLVPIIDFDMLSTPNTQMIFGRNGTGKTHLLEAFYKYCELSFETSKILPVYIDCKDLDLGPVLPSISLDDLIMRFYRRFIHKIIDRLQEFSNRIITVNLLEKIFGGEGKNRKKNIDDRMEKLNSILNMEHIEELLKEYVRKIDFEKEGSSNTEARFGAKSQISFTRPNVSIHGNLELSDKEIEKEKEKIEYIYRGLSVINYESIRDNLENIINQCGARAIVLLVDEWSSVDLSIQPVFAEMIRKTIAVSPKIFLKIVSLKYFTRTSALVAPPQRIGLELGIDINILADIDNLINYDIDRQGVKDFLTLVLYSHCCLDLPKLREYPISEFEKYICSELFSSPEAYLEVVRSSEGNPRDFFSVLSSCCISIKPGDKNKISRAQAIHAAINHFFNNKSPEIKNVYQADILFDALFKKVLANRQKLFLISTRKAETDSRIQELWHHRFIHLINPNYTTLDENYNDHKYSVFSMDYGKLLTLKVNKRGEEVLDRIEKSSTIASSISTAPSISSGGIIGVVLTALNKVILKSIYGQIISPKFMGTLLVIHQGVEEANVNDIESSVAKCVVDNIL